MATVTHQLKLPDGSPALTASVRVRLIAVTDPAGMAEGHVAGSYSIGGAIHPVIDGTGTWAATLAPNSAITPANTVYEVVETLSGLPPAVVYITVPVGGGHVEDLLTAVPASLPSALGPPGPPGIPGPTGLGTTPRGLYTGGTTYAADESVFSGGIWWVSLAGANTGNPTASSPTWWAPLLSSVTINAAALGLLADGSTDNTSTWATIFGLLPSTACVLDLPPGKIVGHPVMTGINGVTINGPASVLHNTVASQDAFKAVNCDYLTIQGVRFQGAAGTRDGLHLENCQRSKVMSVASGGSGRAMMWAQRCFGLVIHAPSLDVQSGPFPAGVANPESGLVLTWDGSDVTSGCNGAVVEGGTFIPGQTLLASTSTTQYTPGWAIQVIRADGVTIDSPITELGAGGVYFQFCDTPVLVNPYCELDPSGIEYSGGTAALTASSTAVVGTGTAWANTPSAPEQANGFPGKYMVAPLTSAMKFSRVAALTDNTHLTLAAQTELLVNNFSGASVAGTYRLVSVDVFLDACRNGNITGKGAGAIMMRSSSNNEMHGVCDSLLLDAGCVLNFGTLIVNRSNTGTGARVIDWGVDNLFRLIDYQTNGIIQDTPVPTYTTATRPSPSQPIIAYVSDGAAGAKFQGWTGSAWVNLG